MSVSNLLNAIDRMSTDKYIKLVDGEITLYKSYDTAVFNTFRKLSVEDLILCSKDNNLLKQLHTMFKIHKSDNVKYILCLDIPKKVYEEFALSAEESRVLLYESLYYLSHFINAGELISESVIGVYSNIIKDIVCMPAYKNYTSSKEDWYKLLDNYYLGSNNEIAQYMQDASDKFRIGNIMMNRMSIVKILWNDKEEAIEIYRLTESLVCRIYARIELSRDLAKAFIYDLKNVVQDRSSITGRVYGDYIIKMLYDEYKGVEFVEMRIETKGNVTNVKFSNISFNTNILTGIEEVLTLMGC